jgi:hypothetical protein
MQYLSDWLYRPSYVHMGATTTEWEQTTITTTSTTTAADTTTTAVPAIVPYA